MLPKFLIFRSTSAIKHHRLISHTTSSAHSLSDSEFDPPFSPKFQNQHKNPQKDLLANKTISKKAPSFPAISNNPQKENKFAKKGLLETKTISKKSPSFPVISKRPQNENKFATKGVLKTETISKKSTFFPVIPSNPQNSNKIAKKGLLQTRNNSKTTPSFPVISELPFDFRYSYSETNPDIQPIGYREPPKFSPFGPGQVDRKWTGTCAPATVAADVDKVVEERKAVIGEALSEEEVADMVEKYRHSDCSRQINLDQLVQLPLDVHSKGRITLAGRGGVTHNMLEDIHSHWRRAEAIRIKCLGLPTLDMDNVCFHLEDKSGGKIIYRHMNVLLLYRGRKYDPENRPVIPLMLFKPYAPIYPKLVKNVADGLTFEETKEKRNQGLNMPPLTKLSRNGVYVNVVDKVRTAFETEEVVRLDCSFAGTSDCKRIGAKLRDLVPCIPILFKDEQIILWRGKQDT